MTNTNQSDDVRKAFEDRFQDLPMGGVFWDGKNYTTKVESVVPDMDFCNDMFDAFVTGYNHRQSEVDALKAENEQLRSVLKIADGAIDFGSLHTQFVAAGSQKVIENLQYGFDKAKRAMKSSRSELDKTVIARNRLQDEVDDLQYQISRLQDLNNHYGDRICVLRDEIERLRNPWISVDERLPEVLAVVMTSTSNSCADAIVGEATYLGDGRFVAPAETLMNPKQPRAFEGVTHWQPLPEPPTKEQAK